MANIIINDIADFLAAHGIGTVMVDIFVGHQPDSPVNCVTVIDTGGMAPPIDFDSKKPTFQILVRNTSYSAGHILLDSIRDLLHNLYGLTLVTGGNYFHSINAMSEGGHIGRDEAGNDEFSMNFSAYVR